VVAFHAGLPVSGGFVGVDVFFVISGFVITQMLLREHDLTGTIRLAAFYVRRFKRLMPALAVMVVATIVMSGLVLSPLGPQEHVAKTGIGAMLLVANVVIVRTTGGYFDAPAETNPLLHTWTLSVEEQFYIAFPLILILGWFVVRRFGRHRWTPAALTAVVTVCSFALAVLGTSGRLEQPVPPIFGFYSPLTRAWEFGVGALLALAGTRMRVRSRLLAVGCAGVAALVASLFVIDGSTPFPGLWTLLPVGATLLLLVAGSGQSNVVSRALAARPMVEVGDRSYSIYLWHWPFIVLAKALWPTTPHVALFAALASFAPALASYKWIEQPIRNLQGLTKPQLARLVGVVVVPPVLIATAMGELGSHYWYPRYESGAMTVLYKGDIGHAPVAAYERQHYYVCTDKQIRDGAGTDNGFPNCYQSKRDRPVTVVLYGDSHAGHLLVGMAERFPRANIALYKHANSDDPWRDYITSAIVSNPTIRTVIVSAWWATKKPSVYGQQLFQTLSAIRRAGKNLYVTDDVPSFPFEPSECKYREALLMPAHCSISASDFQNQYNKYYPALLKVVSRVPGAHMLNTYHYFCKTDRCQMTHDGYVLYQDDSHLNLIGSRYLVKQLSTNYPSFARAVSGIKARR
jgi:peptidoglycan/LPS O-acetylase OafA/YrhL